MTAQLRRELVTDDLLGLTRRLGLPERDLVILAEGNTSELIDDDTIIIKASGSSMETATIDDFVAVSFRELLAIVRNPDATQDDLTAALSTPTGTRASIESLVHVATRAFGVRRFVAHTHPTDVVSLVASTEAATAFAEPVYSEEFMILGRSLYVPYAEPGIELGRLVLSAMEGYVAEHNDIPSLILLGNHGIIAISDTVAGAEAISLMAVKSARVRLGARIAGGVATLSSETTAEYFNRPDFRDRRAHLAGTEGA
ncbi:class II aldolase/adducin family protein [Microbacterium sp. YY-01]|uniref:class II aldolase/adducin family protein n=1 Tax=Microbacterium sp. YY-01 TaxID=3421634 RepID=UPI003D178245